MDSESRQPAVEDNEEKRKVDVLEVLVKKCEGTVKWYSHKLLYGFISRKDNQEDVFCHRSAISAFETRVPNLRNGEEVEFSVVRTTNGIEAFNVTGPNGANVQGFQLRKRPRRGRKKNPSASGDNAENGEAENDEKKPANPRPRRRNRGRGGKPMQANGQPNGNASDADVYYEAGDNEEGGSPSAGESRPVKRDGGFRYGRRGRGGFRGGRGSAARPPSYGGRGRGTRGARRGAPAAAAQA